MIGGGGGIKVLRQAQHTCLNASTQCPNHFQNFYHFRDRSIPELDEILDAKLSEVQDHMRTLMQKQVRLFQPLGFSFCVAVQFGGHLLLGMTKAACSITII